MAAGLSVIIPCYNENKRIIPVIKAVKSSPQASEIIVVDDGSGSSTRQILRKIKDIKLLTHPANRGKSAAMLTGLKAARYSRILFIDSDLKNLKADHIRLLTDPLAHGYKMVITDKTKEFFHSRFSGFSQAYCGERAFTRQDLLAHREFFNTRGYLIEAAFNRFHLNRPFTARVKLVGVGQYPKYQKIGLKGWQKDMDMWFSIMKFLGLKEFFRQLFTALTIPYYKF